MMLNPARIQWISEMLTRVGERELMPRFAAQIPNRVYEKTSRLPQHRYGVGMVAGGLLSDQQGAGKHPRQLPVICFSAAWSASLHT